MSTTTTTTRDRGDRYGPIEWAQLSKDGATRDLKELRLWLCSDVGVSGRRGRRGCVEARQRGLDGRLKSRLELERDVVVRRLAEHLLAGARREVAQPVVVAARQLGADFELVNARNERHVAVVVEHRQTAARIHE